jgi:hypothetical protein
MFYGTGATHDALLSLRNAKVGLETYSNLSSIQNSLLGSEDAEETTTKKFSKAAVRAKLVSEVLETRARCAVCGARLPPSCRSKDHINKAEHDGIGSVDNLQFTHPFCNSARDKIEAVQATTKGQLPLVD